MAKYLATREAKTWQFSSNCSLEENVLIALGKMATFRQAEVSGATLELYASALEGEDMRAFQVAMAVLSVSERQDGETAFPSLGTILNEIDEATEVFPRTFGGRLDREPLMDFPKRKALRA
jgi:hypothetical protein